MNPVIISFAKDVFMLSPELIEILPAIFTLVILLIAVVLFFSEVIPLVATAMLVPVSLSLLGIINTNQAFSGFGNKFVIMFMFMFIVGEGIFQTGLAKRIGDVAVRIAGKNTTLLLMIIMIVVGVMSAFLSNVGTAAVFLPIVLGISSSLNFKSGKLLMPMAFASSLGGMMTLAGTPPNGIANSMLEQFGLKSFGFFEFAKIGVLFLVVGIAYFSLIGRKYLPETSSDIVHRTDKNYRTDKIWIAISILVFIVVMMATKLMPLSTSAVLGAILVIITKCVTVKEAFNSVSWQTIFLFAGMLPMSAAMNSSGAANIIAQSIVANIKSPMFLFAAIYILTAIITNFMSNTVTTSLMVPIGIAIGIKCGISPYPIVMGIAMAASACFLTPIATPTNTIILGPGGYSFSDYFKVGWPLQLISAVLGILCIPLIWPL